VSFHKQVRFLLRFRIRLWSRIPKRDTSSPEMELFPSSRGSHFHHEGAAKLALYHKFSSGALVRKAVRLQ